ncbi:hypothetical protein [Serratia proteamaculans]|uniref:hypothetical protein n=1 Tax=Serratia proteamaculans TaxID=28151 RepID=UPI00111C9385|nr:hypothetical protein [Serratia proteamaculans]
MESSEIESELKNIVQTLKNDRGSAEDENLFSGACYITKGTFRTCFDNVSSAECESIKRQSNADSAQYVPGHSCSI